MSNEITVKKGYCSPYEMGYLAATSDIAYQAGVSGCNSVRTIEDLFYLSAFQCGIEQFLLLGPLNKDKLLVSDFVKKRMILLTKKKHRDSSIASAVFNEQMPIDYRVNNKYKSVYRLEHFLNDVFFSMNSKSSLLIASAPPDMSQLVGVLPTRLFIPVRNLLTKIQYENVELPVPRAIINSDHIKRLHEIIASGLFRNYSYAQEELEHETNTGTKAIENVVNAGRCLFEKYHTVLDIKNTVIGILSATPSLIDLTLGKLPGVLSEIACKLGLNMLAEKRRLVIYNFYPLMWSVMIEEMMRNISNTKTYNQLIDMAMVSTKARNPYPISDS